MKKYIEYNNIHRICAETSAKIKESDFQPDLILAIGGGGYIPARILRTFLKIPIKTVSLELYDDTINQPTNEVSIRQWINKVDVENKNVLLVDEVDDTRTTLHFCVKKLLEFSPKNVAVFVLHDKVKQKKQGLLWNESPPVCDDQVKISHYWPGVRVPDVWLVYPWDASDIDEHTKAAHASS